jgi:hypothetical protein
MAQVIIKTTEEKEGEMLAIVTISIDNIAKNLKRDQVVGQRNTSIIRKTSRQRSTIINLYLKLNNSWTISNNQTSRKATKKAELMVVITKMRRK